MIYNVSYLFYPEEGEQEFYDSAIRGERDGGEARDELIVSKTRPRTRNRGGYYFGTREEDSACTDGPSLADPDSISNTTQLPSFARSNTAFRTTVSRTRIIFSPLFILLELSSRMERRNNALASES